MVTHSASMRWVIRVQILRVVVVGSMLPIRAWVVDWYRVSTGSMFPTIMPGDVVVVDRRVWIRRAAVSESAGEARGRIVAVRIDKDSVPLVKRIAAVRGDTVTVGRYGVLVNGVRHSGRCPDSSAGQGRDPPRNSVGRATGPSATSAESLIVIVVGENEVFPLGDNLAASADSRVFGPIQSEQVLGEARFVIRRGRAHRTC